MKFNYDYQTRLSLAKNGKDFYLDKFVNDV